MIVTCDKCQSRFNLDETLIRDNKATVQCSKCHNVFTVQPLSGNPEEINIDDVLPGPASPIRENPISPTPVEKNQLKKRKEDIIAELNEIDLSEIIENAERSTGKPPDNGIEFEIDTADPLVKKESGSSKELDLEFELDDILEKEVKKPIATSDEIAVEGKHEIDLSDLEEILETERQPKSEKKPKPESEEMKLKLEVIEREPETPLGTSPSAESDQKTSSAQEVAADVIDEIDLSEFQVRAEEEKQAKPEQEKEVKKEEELELDFKIDVEKTHDEPVLEPAPVVKEATKMPAEPAIHKTADPEGKTVSPVFPMPPEKKGMGLPVRIGILILLLGGAISGAVFLMNKIGIEIPYVSSFFGKKSQDSGNLKLIPLEADGKFIQNDKVGKLFVIRGRIRNDYPASRNYAEVTGKLISKTKQILATKTVYCGNSLSDADLARLDIKVIDSRLSNQAGDNKINSNIKSGQIIPFMIVFHSLPEEIDEYSIEVAGSKGMK
jgi:predicted Zn finger-like uncharacterized protein